MQMDGEEFHQYIDMRHRRAPLKSQSHTLTKSLLNVKFNGNENQINHLEHTLYHCTLFSSFLMIYLNKINAFLKRICPHCSYLKETYLWQLEVIFLPFVIGGMLRLYRISMKIPAIYFCLEIKPNWEHN